MLPSSHPQVTHLDHLRVAAQHPRCESREYMHCTGLVVVLRCLFATASQSALTGPVPRALVPRRPVPPCTAPRVPQPRSAPTGPRPAPAPHDVRPQAWHPARPRDVTTQPKESVNAIRERPTRCPGVHRRSAHAAAARRHGTVVGHDETTDIVDIAWDSGSRLSMCLDAGDRVGLLPTHPSTGGTGGVGDGAAAGEGVR